MKKVMQSVLWRTPEICPFATVFDYKSIIGNPQLQKTKDMSLGLGHKRKQTALPASTFAMKITLIRTVEMVVELEVQLFLLCLRALCSALFKDIKLEQLLII